MDETSKASVNDQLYAELDKANLRLQNALLDSRYGEESEFTKQTDSLREFVTNLRGRLRESANEILISNNTELKGFLEEIGIHSDKMRDLQEGGRLAEAVGPQWNVSLRSLTPYFNRPSVTATRNSRANRSNNNQACNIQNRNISSRLNTPDALLPTGNS